MQCNPCLCDRQCDTPAAHCDRCEGEVYREETMYAWEGAHICCVCMEDSFNTMTTREKAELLGAYPVPAAAICALFRGVTKNAEPDY